MVGHLPLDNLQEIETDEIPQNDQWQPTLDAGWKAQEKLASLVDDAFEELSKHEERASMALDDDEEVEEEEGIPEDEEDLQEER